MKKPHKIAIFSTLAIVALLLVGLIVVPPLLKPPTPEEIAQSTATKLSKLNSDSEEHWTNKVENGYFTVDEAKFHLNSIMLPPRAQAVYRVPRTIEYQVILPRRDEVFAFTKFVYKHDQKWAIRYYYTSVLGIPMLQDQGSDDHVDRSWIPQYVYYYDGIREHNEPFSYSPMNKKAEVQHLKWLKLTKKFSQPMTDFDP